MLGIGDNIYALAAIAAVLSVVFYAMQGVFVGELINFCMNSLRSKPSGSKRRRSEKGGKENVQIESSSGPTECAADPCPIDDEKKRSYERKLYRKRYLDKNEVALATQYLVEDHETSFDDIGGLDAVIDRLQRIGRMLQAELTSCLSFPKGVLLYGPPGCGKTMLAKGLGCHLTSSKVRYFHVDPTFWLGFDNGENTTYALGETSSILFSAAEKLGPSIVHIDQIDVLLKSFTHQPLHLRQFLRLWESSRGVMVVGTTNCMQNIDDEFLHRFPTRFHIGLPSLDQRRDILEKYLKHIPGTYNRDKYDMVGAVAGITSGFSGADVVGVCRSVKMNRLDPTVAEAGALRYEEFQEAVEEAKAFRRGVDFLKDTDSFDVLELRSQGSRNSSRS